MLSNQKPVLVCVNPDDAVDCKRCTADRKKLMMAAKVVLGFIAISFGLSFSYVIYQALN